MSAARIFVSYRRDDSRHAAGRLADRLATAFSREAIFMDVDDIAIGDDFVEVLENRIASCEVMLVVIGKAWLSASDEQGRRRLDNPHDFVRVEVESALSRGIRIVPILIDGAAHPRADDLPAGMRDLSRRQATAISHAQFNTDVERIVNGLSQALGGSSSRSPSPPVAPAASRGEHREVTREAVEDVVGEVGRLAHAWYGDAIPSELDGQARSAASVPLSEQIWVLFRDTDGGWMTLGPSGIHWKVAGTRAHITWADFGANPVKRGWLGRLIVGGCDFMIGQARQDMHVFLTALHRRIGAS